MAEKIVMLALSPTMETGTIVNWLKKEGDQISSGDVLCEVETDKATMDYESTSDGTLLKIVSGDGSKVKVGDPIAIIGNKGEDISELLVSKDGHKKSDVQQVQKSEQQQKEIVNREIIEKERIKISPLARQLAKQRGVDLDVVKGSGPGGRIIKEDVEKVTPYKVKEFKHQEKPAALTETEEARVPVSEKRKIIAKRLSESMFTAPHYYLTINVDVGVVMDARKKLNASKEMKITFNAFIIKMVAEALRRHTIVNSSWAGDTIIYHNSIDIGLAVAQKDGLITPVIRNCDTKGIEKIDDEIKILVDKAHQGKLSVEEYSNAFFTISNLGSYGVRNFTAIINPPGSAILAVGEVYKEPYVDDLGAIKVRNCMLMTLSCDHRVIDGAVAAEFAKDLKNIFENPISVLY